MRHNKKGDLSLSINAIVILILAITMLGLGLAFMRNIFGKATQEFTEVSGTVQKQMIDQMKQSDKIVDLSVPRIELKAGDTKQIFIGFNNVNNLNRNMSIRIIDGTQLGAQGVTNSFNVSNLSSTGYNINLSSVTNGICGLRAGNQTYNKVLPDPIAGVGGYKMWLEFKNTPTLVKAGDTIVLPINVKSLSSASTATCVYEIKVDTDTDGPPMAPQTTDYDQLTQLTVDIIS